MQNYAQNMQNCAVKYAKYVEVHIFKLHCPASHGGKL